MVVNAFNQILSIQPDNFEARRRAGRAVRDDEALAGSDRAAAQEGGGRRVGRGQDRAARCASPTCSSRSSRTRRRRSRPTRRSSSWIPTTARRSRFLKQMYEKRRDWEKLIAVNQREIDKLDRRRRAQGPPHRGGQARLREAEEAVGLDRAVAEGARRRRRRTSRRWASSRSCTSARRRGTSWATCWSGRWRVDRRRRRASRRCCVKLGILFTEKVHDAGAGDRGLAGAAGAGAGEPARAGRAEEALPAAEELGRARGVLRRAEQVGRAGPRARAAGRDRGRARRASACGTRSASSIAIA